MTGGDAYKQKLHTDDALDAAIYADPSQPAMLEIGKGSGCPGTPVINRELAVEDETPARRRNAVKTAILLAPV